MQRLIVVLCCLLAAEFAFAQAYVPLSLEEARRYVAANPEAAAVDVAKLDAIEHAVPAVAMPAVAVIVHGRDVGVSWPQPIDVSVAGGALHYQLTPEPLLARGVVPEQPWWEAPAWGAGGAAAGILLTLLLAALLR